jgi:energy-coupling factor transporter ATP-binding protein EcfA2
MTLPIEVRHLGKRFGPVTAVDDVSFEVAPGRVTGFLGPNGAGKTTTLRMLLGLVTPASGTAAIGGRPYRELACPLRQVGVVLESSGAHPGRTARNHLRLQAMLALSTALTLALALLRAIRSTGGNASARLAAGPLSTAHGLAEVLASPTYAMILALALGVAATAGEFRHGTATLTYLAVPARTKVLAAKCCAALPAGALFGIASAASTATGLAFVAAHGYHLTMPAATIIRYAAGDAAGCALLAALGALSGPIIPYLPFQAATSLAGTTLPGGAGTDPEDPGSAFHAFGDWPHVP